MLYKTLSAAVYGIDANIIQVEVDCSGIKCDQDHFHTVGLPDAAVRESRDRVRAADIYVVRKQPNPLAVWYAPTWQAVLDAYDEQTAAGRTS